MLMPISYIFYGFIDGEKLVLMVLVFVLHEESESLLSSLLSFLKLIILLPSRGFFFVFKVSHLVGKHHPRELLVYLFFLVFLQLGL